jgi:hypothetical protein
MVQLSTGEWLCAIRSQGFPCHVNAGDDFFCWTPRKINNAMTGTDYDSKSRANGRTKK